MKYTTILPAFLFLAGSALLPISSYAGYENEAEKKASSYCEKNPDAQGCTGSDGDDGNNDGGDGNDEEEPMNNQ